ncbi:hypothetical protein BH10ACT1_BH10ACT1_21220 [soil metagenome]
MEYNLYRISTATLSAIAVALLVGVVLAVLLHRRTAMGPSRSVWIAASAVSAAAVLMITLAPSGRGGTYACSFAVEGSVLDWTRGNQSTANVAMLMPVAVVLPLATRGTRWYPWSFPALLAFPLLIEAAQANLPVGRACDVTDVVDNWWGVACGCLLGWAATAVWSTVRLRRANGAERSEPA